MTGRVEFYRHGLGEAELESVGQTLSSLFLTLGPRVADFERRFAEYLGAEHCVGVSSCSMALLLTLKAFGVGDGDEVITTPMTFIATSNAVLHAGAKPVFADIEPGTGLLDPNAVEAAITDRTKAVIAVHLYGQLADMKALRALCERRGLVLIEDAAHAVETERDGIRTAELGDAAVFSFYATKNLTSGDGGAIVLHDREAAERLRRLRNHGVTKDAASRHGGSYRHWDMVDLGFKAAMTDVEAALLLPQLEGIDARRDAREERALRYRELLADEPRVQLIEPVGTSAHHLFAVLVPEGRRDSVLDGLGERQVGCAINYRSVHTLAYYRDTFGYRPEDFPVSASFGERTISLPMWPALPLDDVSRVVSALRESLDAAERRPATTAEASP